MKKFVVLKIYKGILPQVVFTSNDFANATSYATIMSKEEDYEFAVAEVKVSFVEE